MKYIFLLLFTAFCFSQDGGKIILGSEKQIFSQDGSTNAMSSLSWEHHEIHEGDHYFVNGYTTLGSGDSIMFEISTPNSTKWTHMVFDVISSGILETRVYEGGTVTGRTAITPQNNNRNYANASIDTVGSVTFAQVSSFGTCIDSLKVGSAGGSKFGGTVSRSKENVLKQDETYIYIFISGGAANIVSFQAGWYEHVSKNN